jgi:thiol-disulfide isomerase/thioredoxin
MDIYKSPGGYYYIVNKKSNDVKRISKEEYNNIHNPKKKHSEQNIKKYNHKVNNPNKNHSKKNEHKQNQHKQNQHKQNQHKQNQHKQNQHKQNQHKMIPKMNNSKKQNLKGMIVLFYGDWCGHCHHMMPEWDKFMENNKDNKIKIMKIESSNEPVMRKHEIRGFPTIRYLPNGLKDKKHVEFRGNRNHIDLKRFLESLSR